MWSRIVQTLGPYVILAWHYWSTCAIFLKILFSTFWSFTFLKYFKPSLQMPTTAGRHTNYFVAVCIWPQVQEAKCLGLPRDLHVVYMPRLCSGQPWRHPLECSGDSGWKVTAIFLFQPLHQYRAFKLSLIIFFYITTAHFHDFFFQIYF